MSDEDDEGDAQTPGCCLTGDLHLRLNKRLLEISWYPPFIPKSSAKRSLTSFAVAGWMLKMELRGLTVRKAGADLFERFFVTVKPAHSD